MLLEIEDLSVSFRNDEGEVNAAAVDVSLKLDRGEILGIVGESGSGKSSVSMSVARLLPSPPAFYPKGRILLDGVDTLTMPLADLRRIRGKKIGVIFQDPMGSLSPLHRIGDQLVETILLHEEMSKKAAEAMALEWLGKVGIPDPIVRAKAYPHELSGGMQQRVMIAMGLMLGPDLVIADEPTTALDVTIQAQILDLLRQLKDKINSSIMLITHDLGVIAEMADYVVVMYAGRIVEKGTAEEIFAHPCPPYTIGLMASKPVVGKKVDKLYSIPGKVPNPVDMPDYCYFKDRCEKQLDRCKGEYPGEISVSPTHKVSCYRYYEENRKAGE